VCAGCFAPAISQPGATDAGAAHRIALTDSDHAAFSDRDVRASDDAHGDIPA
jgi:hypothetical protein